MGYFINNDIAKISKSPAKVSLSENSNFIEFEGYDLTGKEKGVDIKFKITGNGINPIRDQNVVSFNIVEVKTNTIHHFSGNKGNSQEGGDNSFFMGRNYTLSEIADNFKVCLQKNVFFKDRFKITIELDENVPGIYEAGTTIHIQSIGIGEGYAFKFAPHNPVQLEEFFMLAEGNPSNYIVPSLLPTQLEITPHVYIKDWIEVILPEGGTKPAASYLGYMNNTEFTITETKTGTSHVFRGTSDLNEIDSNKFYIGPPIYPSALETNQIAENLKLCLQKNSYLGVYFDINVSLQKDGDGNLTPSSKIEIKPKGTGEEYAFKIIYKSKVKDKDFLKITGNPEAISNNDSISLGYTPAEIQLEFYKDTGIFLGESDAPKESISGTQAVTLTKSYSGIPLWFNVNALKHSEYSNAFLTAKGWCDAGTIKDYRFVARRVIGSEQYYDNTPFYYSNVLYLITGAGRNLEQNDLDKYVYSVADNNLVYPLSNQPTLFHLKGQSQYFNFILSAPKHTTRPKAESFNIGINYRLYTQSKQFVAEVSRNNKPINDMSMVNTIRLDIDEAIGKRTNIGMVEVYLSRAGTSISHPLTFKILPDCLYKVNDFAFLNRLGGWSSFNFSGADASEFKASGNTIFKNQTPDYTISDEIESVHNRKVTESFTVETMPIDRTTAEWLKELSSSVAVYELSTGRYVVVEDLKIKQSSKNDLLKLEMKYHYSDSFNAQIKL